MIYLDNNATTKVAPEVVAEMLRVFSDAYQNASSVSGEVLGVKSAISRSRADVARLVGTNSDSIVFTSGATESNNWVIGATADLVDRPGHLVTSAIEHPSVLEPMRRLERQGWRLTILPVDTNGIVRLDQLDAALCGKTVLVSVMAANNETGVLQPISQIANLVKAKSPHAFFHTDATQKVGKVSISLDEEWTDVDFISFSGHKFHGPKGIGALFIREGLELPPLLLGGGQEEGRRSGTLNTPGIVGLAAAANLAKSVKAESARIVSLRDKFEQDLTSRFPDVVIHGTHTPRLPNTSCFSLPGCNGNHLAELLAQDGICVGTGSACSAGALHPPKSLLEMGVDYELAAAALRVSLSRFSMDSELKGLLDRLAFRKCARVVLEGAVMVR